MPLLRQRATSTLMVWQQVNADVDPLNDPVFLAFLPVPPSGAVPDPAPGDWNTGVWGNLPVPGNWAGCLVGPANGGLVLTVNTYLICVKVQDNPEVPELDGWLLEIY